MKRFLFSTGHKQVGLLFLTGSMATFVLAGVTALLIRFEQSHLGPTVTDDPGDYNVWLYFHGAAMILGFAIPGLTGFFASYFLPMMIGANDVAFPRLNALSAWLFLAAIVVTLLSFVIPDPPDIMWTGYPPYSVTTEGNTAFFVFTVLLLGFSAVLGSVNFLVTVIFKRAKGMGWNQLNIFVWTTIVALADQLIFVPVLAAAVLMLAADRYFNTTFFDPSKGGDVLLYQNLFWFYSHPAVYVIFLPAIGILFEIVTAMARNRVFQYKVAVWFGILGILIIAGEVWVHHLYVTGMPNWIRAGMMITTLLISVPVGMLAISLWGTLYKGSIVYNTPMLYAVSGMLMLLLGGLTGIPLGMTSVDVHLSDTTYVHAHFHFAMAVFATFAIFGGLYYWFPKITGRMYSEKLGMAGWLLNLVGVNLTFLPLMSIGVEGMPRRYYDYPMFPGMEGMHQAATAGAILSALGIAVTLYSWYAGARRGPRVGQNPWGARSLEWTHAASRPENQSFARPVELPAGWGPYEYGPEERR